MGAEALKPNRIAEAEQSPPADRPFFMSSSKPLAPHARLAAACLLEGLVESGLEAVAFAAQPAPTPAQAPLPAADLETRIAACRACALGSSRQYPVPGEGSGRAQLFFVGEAPGAEEDRQGRPFVGPAGQLLDKIIEGGMGLARQDVFIANILKCRPPANRDPLPTEVAACTPFLEEQIAALQPKLLIALGRHAAHHLLQTEASLSSLRGVLHNRPQGGPKVLVTYHPAYLLRNPAAKRACWEDIQLGMQFLGLPTPQR